MSWCDCSKVSEVLVGAHIIICGSCSACTGMLLSPETHRTKIPKSQFRSATWHSTNDPIYIAAIRGIRIFSSWRISLRFPFLRYWSILDPLALLPMQGMAFKVKSGPLKETALLILAFLSVSTSSCRTAGLRGLQTQVKYLVQVPRTPLTSICGVRLSILNQMLQKQGLYIYVSFKSYLTHYTVWNIS